MSLTFQVWGFYIDGPAHPKRGAFLFQRRLDKVKKIDLRKIQDYYKEDLFGSDEYEEEEGGYFLLEEENRYFGVEDAAKEDKTTSDYMVGIPDDYPAITALRFALKMDEEKMEKMIKVRRYCRKQYGLLENPNNDRKSEDEILEYLRLMVTLGDIEGLHKAIENLLESGKLRGYFFTRVLVEDLRYTYFDSELVARLCLNMLPNLNLHIYEDQDLTDFYREYGKNANVQEINKCLSEGNDEMLGFLGASFDDMPDKEIADRYTEIIQKELDKMDLA